MAMPESTIPVARAHSKLRSMLVMRGVLGPGLAPRAKLATIGAQRRPPDCVSAPAGLCFNSRYPYFVAFPDCRIRRRRLGHETGQSGLVDGETGEGRVFTVCKHRWLYASQVYYPYSRCYPLFACGNSQEANVSTLCAFIHVHT